MAIGVQGLVLFWLQMWGSSARVTNLAFCLATSEMHGWLQFGQRALLCSSQCHPAAIVRSTDGEDINGNIDAVAAKHPLLGGEHTWTAADGLKLPLQQSSH